MNRYENGYGSTRARIECDRAMLEDALATLVHDATLLDRSIKLAEGARAIALRIATVQVSAANVQARLGLAQIDVWNEV